MNQNNNPPDLNDSHDNPSMPADAPDDFPAGDPPFWWGTPDDWRLMVYTSPNENG